MDLQELSRYFKIVERLRRDKEILASLEAAAQPGAQVLTGMPHATGVNDKVGDLAVEIADMRNRIGRLQAAADRELVTLEAYIDAIQNDQTRMVFRLRFVRCLKWWQVARILGGGNTEQTVKMICYRYIEGQAGKSCDPV